MGYNAGSLELPILGDSNNVVLAIKNTIKSLNSLNNAIKKINSQSYTFAGQKLDYIFEKLAKASNKLNATNLENFASAAKSINSISRLSNLGKVNWDDIASGFTKMTVAITPFINAVKDGETSLTALYGTLNKMSGKGITGSSNSKANKAYSNFNLGFSFAKIRLALAAAKRLGQSVYKVVQYGSDFVETLNLWQVSMRDNLDLADEFVKKMHKAYGVSTQTLMNAQAIFRNMLGSLGQISDASAYALSEALTQMALDFSSLYNVKIGEALEKFQAMLAGQVRPIRSAGLDITETTLFMYYQQLGGTKTMRQLNRTEKQLLSILAVFKQMEKAGALGDMAKTIETFANQTKMASENFKEMLTWIGISIQYLIQESRILVKVNALFITLSEIFKSIAHYIGYETPDFTIGWTESIEETTDAVEKLQDKLLGFDEFRALEDSSDNSLLSIDEALLNTLVQYNSFLTNANNSATKLSEEWLQILGFQKDAETGLWESSEATKNLISNLQTIFSVFSNIISSVKQGSLDTTTNILSIISKIIWGVSQLVEDFEPLITVIADIYSSLSGIVSSIIGEVSLVANYVLFLFEPLITNLVTIFTAIFEFIQKIFKTVELFVTALVNWEWSGFGSKFVEIWSNWDNTRKAYDTQEKTYYNYRREGAFDRFLSEQYNVDTGYANTAPQAPSNPQGGNSTPPIMVTIDGREVFYAVQSTGKQLGYEIPIVR